MPAWIGHKATQRTRRTYDAADLGRTSRRTVLAAPKWAKRCPVKSETWWCIKSPRGDLYVSSAARTAQYAWINFAGSIGGVDQVRKDFDDYKAIRIRVTELRQQRKGFRWTLR